MTNACARMQPPTDPSPVHPISPVVCMGVEIERVALLDAELRWLGRPPSATGRAARRLLVEARNRRAAACRACGMCPLSQTILTLPTPD